MKELTSERRRGRQHTEGGYIKRVSVETFCTQSRGGRGVILATKREDVVQPVQTKAHDHVLFFTSASIAYTVRFRHHAPARGTAPSTWSPPPGDVTRSSPSIMPRARSTW